MADLSSIQKWKIDPAYGEYRHLKADLVLSACSYRDKQNGGGGRVKGENIGINIISHKYTCISDTECVRVCVYVLYINRLRNFQPFNSVFDEKLS